ncbi:hypothetical protein KUK86_004440 [Vibrio parahaemolyticus]|nr:hypothetical protein [Vibrio parahaemolyticus]
MKLGKKTLLTILVIILGLAVSVVQAYFWTQAGRTKNSKVYEYEFQLDFWNEEIHKKFNSLRESGVGPRLAMIEGKRVVDSSYFSDIHQYHFLIKELMRALKFKSKVSINLLSDIVSLQDKGLQKVGNPEELVEKIKEFSDLLKEFEKRQQRLDSYLPELISSFEYDTKLSESEKVELTVKQINLLGELYTNEELFIKREPDPFTFVRDLGESSYTMLHNYEEILLGYNNQVSQEDTYKKILILILTLASVYLSALIVLIPEESDSNE